MSEFWHKSDRWVFKSTWKGHEEAVEEHFLAPYVISLLLSIYVVCLHFAKCEKASRCPGTVFSEFCLAGWGQRPVNISFWVWLCYIMCHTFCILRSVLSLLYFPLQCARHGRTACWELDGKEFAWEATLSKIVLFNININMNFEININISTNKL